MRWAEVRQRRRTQVVNRILDGPHRARQQPSIFHLLAYAHLVRFEPDYSTLEYDEEGKREMVKVGSQEDFRWTAGILTRAQIRRRKL